jgi:hypothetical protein
MRRGMPGVMMGCSLAAALAVAGPVAAQTDGTVTWDMSAGGGSGVKTMVQTFHGSQERMEMPGGMGSILMDASSGTMTMLMNSQKMYTQMNVADIPQKSAPQSNGTVSVTKDGNETVAGIPCTDYKLTGMSTTQDADAYEICAAPGVPSMDPKFLTNGPMGASAGRMGLTPQVVSVMQQLRGQGALKVYKISGGQKTVVMVATKVDRTPPDPSLFVVPKDYNKFQMPAGMQGAPGMAQPGTGQPKSP